MLEILNRTPYWAYLIFFYVLKNGIQALKDNEVTIIRLFIFPIIFIGLQIASFHTTINCLIYLVSLGVGYKIGYWLAPNTKGKVDSIKKTVYLKGTPYTLIIEMIIFSIQYCFGCMQSVYPDIALQYLNLKLLVSGLITGLLLGKAIFYYKKASPN